MSEETFRIAVVGAGRMGRVHIAALERSQEVDVEGSGRAGRVDAQRSGPPRIRVFATVAELLREGGIDGVLIAAPTDLHLKLVETVVGAGVPVLCEKPVGTRAADATAARRSGAGGVAFQVGYWRRFVPELRALRERIVAGELANSSRFPACNGTQSRRRLVPGSQWGDRGRHGGARVRPGAVADRTGALVGDSHAGRRRGHPDADPDVATIVARLAGGTLLTVSVRRIFPEGDCCWVEVFGTAGYERIPFMWGPPRRRGVPRRAGRPGGGVRRCRPKRRDDGRRRD